MQNPRGNKSVRSVCRLSAAHSAPLGHCSLAPQKDPLTITKQIHRPLPGLSSIVLLHDLPGRILLRPRSRIVSTLYSGSAIVGVPLLCPYQGVRKGAVKTSGGLSWKHLLISHVCQLCGAQRLELRCCVRPATLLPYPACAELRPEALRPNLSNGLPFSSSHKAD